MRGHYLQSIGFAVLFPLVFLEALTSSAIDSPLPATDQFLSPAMLGNRTLQSTQPSMSPPTGVTYWNANTRFVGSKQCAACHPAQAKTFHENSMSRALEPIESCQLLKGDVRFSWSIDQYNYLITQRQGKVVYRVTDGKDMLEAPLEYAFGQGKAGQTYVFKKDDVFYETRVSYYSELNGLALTVGAANSKPASLLEAAGRRMDEADTRDCFGCHTTGARVGNTLQLKTYEPGVQCESCHGPGGAHIDSITDGRPAQGSIRSLKGMGPQQANEFCGVCHRTWETVMTMGLRGINNARFPPYRLTNSPCFSVDDPRIACTACHDPHQALVVGDTNYDSKCTACHNLKNASLKKRTCPVGKEACTSCHMPKIPSPEAHHAFRDHWIRIVRAKDGYPD